MARRFLTLWESVTGTGYGSRKELLVSRLEFPELVFEETWGDGPELSWESSRVMTLWEPGP